MAIGATKPATPQAVAEAAIRPEDAVAPTIPPPAREGDVRIPPGTMVSDRYKISRVLGEGGMGVVYLAEHVLMRKEVAVKVLHAEMCSMPEVVGRFEREAIAAAHIDHPNVAGATDFGRLDDGSCYLVLELLRGSSLRDEISKGPIPLGRSLRLLRGIASGVSAAHAKGIVHRDLKPENVMLVERDGMPDFVKVLDFGIAKVDTTVAAAPQAGGKILTRVGAVFGTPEYMAPEQAVGDTVDARADLYALGVIFLEMLTGKCPFQGNALSILRERILAVGPPDMSGVADQGARDLVSRLLTRQPEDRMQTSAELVTTIDGLLEDRGKAGSMPPPSPNVATNPPGSLVANALTSTASTSTSRAKWMIPAAIVGALAITFGTFGIVRGIGRPKGVDSTTTATKKHDSTKHDTSSQPVTATTTTPAIDPSSAASSSSSPATDPSTSDNGENSSAGSEPSTNPAPTASAASARAPRGKPKARPQPPPKKTGPGGIYIPPPSQWLGGDKK